MNPGDFSDDSGKHPCDGKPLSKYLFYEPKISDDGKQISCSLDEDGDLHPEYSITPIMLHVIPRLVEMVKPLGKKRLPIGKFRSGK